MSARLDLTIINPGSRTEVYQTLGETLTAIEPPVWAGLITQAVRQRGYSVEIIDAEAEALLPSAVASRVAAQHPRLVTVVVYGHQPSASTQNMPAAVRVCSALKAEDPRLPLLVVGGHAAALPERTLAEAAADFVCTGEGLQTVTNLIEALKAGTGDFTRVPDLCYRDGPRLGRTAPAPLLRDLDRDLPGMAWDLLPMDRYRAHNWHCFGDLHRQPYASLYTTLGCPYRCTFCCIQAPFKSGEAAAGLRPEVNSYRYWSPEAVMREIDLLVSRYGVKNIKLADEMFVLNTRHVTGICDIIIERGYDLNIWAYARIDTVRSEAILEKLRQAGVHWLALGIESASQRVRQDVGKDFDQGDIFHSIDRIRAAGIDIIGNYIFGLPEDDVLSMQATLDMALALKCEFANFYCAMAYPGSQLYRTALAEGWPLPQSWSGWSQHSIDCLPLPTRYLSAAEVLAFRDQAFHSYFADPAYLAHVGRRFGPDTVDHIRSMASHRLERRYASTPA